MQKVRVTLTGTMPLLMHADNLADPLDPVTKEFKKISGKRKKTDDDFEALAEMEFQASLYAEGETIVLPATNLKKAFIEGGRVTKDGPKVERGVTLLGVSFPLDYGSSLTKKDLYTDTEFVDRRSVKVGTARTMRVRPIFRNWSVDVEAMLDPAVLSADDFEDICKNTGNLIGLGDHRKVGGYGRFDAKVTVI